MHTRMVRMNAGYRGDGERAIDAYEALLLDVIRGDATNFIRFDEVEWAWRVVDPILEVLGPGARLHPQLSGRELGAGGSEPAVRVGLPDLAQRGVSYRRASRASISRA